ncbi:hypothetical protein DPMN_133454 [Dreissena polymorpha]|uniref:Uncharacterized protein n=1 Tax=Dreissena polymorpha TaxID=45954 RepID=A0A9D4JE05_DREPO|nr:hypothetical protein DPMN_133454 [Dreissena polymorpha]
MTAYQDDQERFPDVLTKYGKHCGTYIGLFNLRRNRGKSLGVRYLKMEHLPSYPVPLTESGSVRSLDAEQKHAVMDMQTLLERIPMV